MRIQRHDKIVELVATKLRKRGYVVYEEPHYHVNGRLFKPDLVYTKSGQSWILDPTLIWEGTDLFDRGAKAQQAKALKYDCLRNTVERQTDTTCVGVFGLVLGVRGTVHSLADIKEAQVGGKGFAGVLCEWVIKHSLKILKSFAGMNRNDILSVLDPDEITVEEITGITSD